MKKLVIIIILILSLAIIGVGGYYIYKDINSGTNASVGEEDYDTLLSRYVNAQNDIATLNADKANLEEQLQVIENRLAEIERDIALSEDAKDNEILALRNEKTALLQDKVELSARVVELQNEVSILSNNLQLLQNRYDILTFSPYYISRSFVVEQFANKLSSENKYFVIYRVSDNGYVYREIEIGSTLNNVVPTGGVAYYIWQTALGNAGGTIYVEDISSFVPSSSIFLTIVYR